MPRVTLNSNITTNSQNSLQSDPNLPQIQQGRDHQNDGSAQSSHSLTNINSNHDPIPIPPAAHARRPPQHKARVRHNNEGGPYHRYPHQHRDYHNQQQHRRPHSDAERRYRHNMGDKFEHLRQRLIQSSEFPVVGSSGTITANAPSSVNGDTTDAAVADSSSNVNVEVAGNGGGGTDLAKINKAFVLEQAVALIDRLEGVVKEQHMKIEVLGSRLEQVRDLLGGKTVEGTNDTAAAAAVRKKPEFDVMNCTWVP